MNAYFRKRELIKQLEAKFDSLYERATELLRKHNPCKIKNHCGKLSCVGVYSGKDLCCGGCIHLTSTGCSAEKPLACRLWLCRSKLVSESVLQEFEDLRKEAEGYHFYVARGDKRDSIKNSLKWYLKAFKMVKTEGLTNYKVLIN